MKDANAIQKTIRRTYSRRGTIGRTFARHTGYSCNSPTKMTRISTLPIKNELITS